MIALSPTSTLIAVAAAQCVAILVCAVAPNGPSNSLTIGVRFGIEFAIVGILATWAVLGPLPGRVRWPGSLGGTAVVALTMAAWFYLGPHRDSERAWLAILAISIQYAATQLPLWWLRLRHGYQIQMNQIGPPRTGLGETQFTLRQLMIVTTAVAMLLGLVRALGSLEGLAWDTGSTKLLTVFALLGTFNTLLVWLAIAAGVSRISPWLGGAVVLILLCPLTMLQILAFTTLMGVGSERETWFVCTLNYVQIGWLLGSLLLLRRAGYRLRPVSSEVCEVRE